MRNWTRHKKSHADRTLTPSEFDMAVTFLGTPVYEGYLGQARDILVDGKFQKDCPSASSKTLARLLDDLWGQFFVQIG